MLLVRFWPATRGVRRWIALGAVFAAVLPLGAAAEIWLFARLVDDVLVSRDLGPLPLIVGLFIGINLAGAAVEFGKRIVGAWAMEQFVLGLRGTVFAHVLRLSPLQLRRWPHGDLLTRLSGDVVALQRVLVSGPGRVVSAVVRIVVYVGMLFWIDPILALLVLVATPLVLVAGPALRHRDPRCGSGATQSLGGRRLAGRRGGRLARRGAGRPGRALRAGPL